MTPSGLAPIDPALPPGAGASGGGFGPADDSAGAASQQPPHPGDSPLVPTPHGRHATGDDAGSVADEPGPLLAAGNSADVFALDDGHVLRRYRSGHDAAAEVALMRHVAAHGFPVPEVVGVDGPDVVMERLHGPTLLQALGAEEVSLHDGAQILVDLHRRLHAVPAPEGAPAGDVVVHLDLHPGNVILSESRGPALVDWANARTGSPGLDVALTALLIAEVAVDAGGVYSQGARVLLAAFLAAADVDPSAALDEGVGVRTGDPSLLEGEAELVPQAAALIRDLIEVARPS
jgi:aminoglycoside phosphotransferase (APT) family kinase protein